MPAKTTTTMFGSAKYRAHLESNKHACTPSHYTHRKMQSIIYLIRSFNHAFVNQSSVSVAHQSIHRLDKSHPVIVFSIPPRLSLRPATTDLKPRACFIPSSPPPLLPDPITASAWRMDTKQVGKVVHTG